MTPSSVIQFITITLPVSASVLFDLLFIRQTRSAEIDIADVRSMATGLTGPLDDEPLGGLVQEASWH
jgi:hypothetical protein